MDFFGIIFVMLLLVSVFCELRNMRTVFEAEWDSIRPLDIQPDDEHPCTNNNESDPDNDYETETSVVYLGEPWFASVNLQSWGLQSGAIALAILAFIGRGEGFLNLASEWIDVHPYWSGAIGLMCLVVALILGVFRQAFIKLLSLAAALPIVGEDGRPTLAYIGDVPPFLWQRSPWFRAGSWLVVAVTSLVFAYIHAELLSQTLDGGFALLFGLLLLIRWAVSSLPSQFWME